MSWMDYDAADVKRFLPVVLVVNVVVAENDSVLADDQSLFGEAVRGSDNEVHGKYGSTADGMSLALFVDSGLVGNQVPGCLLAVEDFGSDKES